MKKFFTLIAAVALAASVNAQGTYAVQVGAKVNAGDRITSVKNVTLTYMENAGTAFVDGKAIDNWADGDFTAKNNGKLVKGAEPTGCVYKFETANAGTLTVAIQMGANKDFHILDADFAEVTPASYNLPSAKDGESQKFTLNDRGENIIGAKSNGVVKFNVVAGGTYYVLAAGTRLGFFGFKYEVGTSTGISSVNAAAAKKNGKTYNMAGQEVSSSAKGIVIKNGKKYVK